MNTEVVNIKSINIPIYKNILSNKLIDIIKLGRYEETESNLLPMILEKDEVIMEVGAGIGFLSSLALKTGKVKEMYVYEANPNLIPIIKEVHQLNDVDAELTNAVLIPNAKKNNLIELDFFIRHDFWASSLDPEPWKYKEKVKVKVLDLEEEILRINPSMLIVDIEGGEKNFFENINLHNVNKIFMEVHQKVIGRSGIKKLFDTLSSAGFHYDQWHSRGGVILFSHVNRQT